MRQYYAKKKKKEKASILEYVQANIDIFQTCEVTLRFAFFYLWESP